MKEGRDFAMQFSFALLAVSSIIFSLACSLRLCKQKIIMSMVLYSI